MPAGRRDIRPQPATALGLDRIWATEGEACRPRLGSTSAHAYRTSKKSARGAGRSSGRFNVA